jgi:hypothetical protein
MSRIGRFAACLAVAAQLVFGVTLQAVAVTPTPVQRLAVLLADPAGICHGTDQPGTPSRHHHDSDCLLCACCAPMVGAAILRGDVPALAPPRAGIIATGMDAARHAIPPPSLLLAARPRGPPFLA